MPDSFSETTHASWGSRIVSSLSGIVIGFVLIILSIVLLGWNEANTLDTTKSLKEGSSSVIDIPPGAVDPANDGKLVHVTGAAAAGNEVADPDFGISAKALRLSRSVEMYQWDEKKSEEEKKNLGGGTDTVTTYNYEKTWSGSLIDSSKFKQPAGHENPQSMIADSETFVAGDITLGAFRLPDSIVGKMTGDKPLSTTQEELDRLPEGEKKTAQLIDNGFYFGANPKQAAIGDQRVTFEALEPGTFSIVAQQTGGTFQPFLAKAGKPVELVASGSETAALMFKHAQDENNLLAWLLRVAGFVLMWIGLAAIFRPLSVIADVVPFLGGIVGAGSGLVTFFLAVAGSIITIAVAWLAVRPLLGGTLLVAAGAVLAVALRAAFRRRKKAS